MKLHFETLLHRTPLPRLWLITVLLMVAGVSAYVYFE